MNPNTIPWLHCQDIQIPDVAIRQQFNQYMINGQYTAAISLLSTNEQQLQGKAFVADTVIKIINGIINLQDRFNTGVNIYLSNLASQYMMMINNLNKKGQWNPLVQYVPYNFVIYQDDIYMAIQTVPIGTLPTNTEYWLYLGLQGIDGVPGTDVIMRYEWQSNRQYELNDVVSYRGNLYVAIKSNTGIIPGSDEETWLTFLLVTEGGINVGMNPPDIQIENTIWFKTDSDPLQATDATPIIGQFYRYAKNGQWEEMYPLTIFTLVDGREIFAPIASVVDLTINSDQWNYSNGTYSFTYTNQLIVETSNVEVYIGRQMTDAQYKLYSSLSLVVIQGEIKFTTITQPTASIYMKIKIQ